jgi:hypothetical protein
LWMVKQLHTSVHQHWSQVSHTQLLTRLGHWTVQSLYLSASLSLSLSSTQTAEDTHFNFPAQITFSPSLSLKYPNYWRHPFQLSWSQRHHQCLFLIRTWTQQQQQQQQQ